MTEEYGVIKMATQNMTTGYADVSFFKSIITDTDGHIKIVTTNDPFKAMLIKPLPFDTIGGNAIKTLIEFIEKNVFKGTKVEFKTFQIQI